uniref:Uncharacterized protein n=2 Tax=Ornithodoros turicata TaxID=34597 RepID=A0A2R5L642_9ACAR
MHSLGGFTCSFSSGRVCRFCLAKSSELRRLTSESQCIVRDAQNHSAQLEAVHINPDLCSVYGVREMSPLLKLDSFDVTRQLPPDVMHDMFEGTFVFVIHNTLRGLVQDGVLTVDDITRVDMFPYGANDIKNKPEKMSAAFLADGKSIRGTASQKWCLFRFIPLIFGPLVPEGNEKWELFLTFRELADIILAEKIPPEGTQYLESNIAEFLSMFMEMYPTVRIPPKLHYMIHYPRIIRELGPLRQYWCLRFEAKHQFLKNHATRVHNFRNIPYTLARKHQLLQSYQLSTNFMDRSCTTTNLRPADLSSAHPCTHHLFCSNVNLADSAKFDGLSYKVGDILVMAGGDNPKFAQVQELLVSAGRLYLQLEQMFLEAFCKHTFAYKLRPTGEMMLSLPGEEVSIQKLDLYHGGLVVPKWEIMFQ